MFYHYRQTIFKSPSPQNYDTNEQSRNVSAFFEIIKEFSPDFIIALGLRLYHMLPDENVIYIKEIENESPLLTRKPVILSSNEEIVISNISPDILHLEGY